MQLNEMHSVDKLSGGGGGGTECNRRRVDGSSTWLRLEVHRLAAAADGGGSGDWLRPDNQ